MRILAAIGLGFLVMAIVAFEATMGAGAVDADAGLAAGLFAGAAVYDLFAGFITYLAPVWIALARAHPDARGIATLNLLLGWTVIGWIVAMMWALSRMPGEAPAMPGPAFRR